MKALREAKACLADTVAITHTADRLKTALAVLVEEIEAAPVGEASAMVDQVSESLDVSGIPSEQLNTLNGQRVRVLAVGEQP